ncbi:hypothetical protein HCN44_001760 [Aphidius gifuensis]|uniref:Odorant receptor n=1 Tax=Aphidius gifuensis TaxID=684658 RepID=A0A835CTK5_APHGI|nr:hypothetical protein HCN44_001760 [Aphidius gifuensis]
MLSNNNGFNYEIGWNKFHLKLFGLWPDKKKLNWGLFHAACIFFVLTIPRFAALLILWGDYDIMIQTLSTHLPFLMVIIKLSVLSLKKKVFIKMYNEISNDWNESIAAGYYHVVKKYANISRDISFLSFLTVWFACIAGTIAQLFYNMEKLLLINPDPNLSINLFWVCWLPYNTTTTINYIITMLLQIYASFCGIIIYASFDLFIMFLILQLVGHCRIIQESLRNLKDDSNNPQVFWIKLKKIIIKHQKINELTEILENTFNYCLLFQLVGCAFTFCFQGYSIMMLIKRPINILQIGMAGILMFGSILQLFLYCWTCEMLISESLAISYSFYESNWYKLPVKKAQCLTIVGYRAFKPLNITVGKFSKLSYGLFIDVDFKNAYSLIKLNLDFFGLWPMSRDNFLADNLALIHGINIFFIIFIPRSIAFLLIFGQTDVMIQSLSTNIPCILSLVKLYIFYKRKKVITLLFGLYNFFYLINFLYKKYSSMEIDKKNAPDPRLTLDLVWVSYVPYNVHKTKTIFVIHWIVQLYASVIGVVCYLAFDCFCVFLIFHLIGQLIILQEKIRNINNINNKNKNSENLLTKLINIVKRHQELIRFTETLENCFNKVLLSQLMGSCLNVSVQGYFLLGNFIRGELSLFQAAFTISFVLYTLTHLFFLCYAGELLVQTSMKIGFAAYEAEWYDLSTNEGKLLMFVTLNSMRSLKITTGKFAILSYELFITVIRTSLSYLSVLLAAKDSKS